MARGEIAHHKQFHLWPQRFQKSSAFFGSKCVCKWERVKLSKRVNANPTIKSTKDYNPAGLNLRLGLPAPVSTVALGESLHCPEPVTATSK